MQIKKLLLTIPLFMVSMWCMSQTILTGTVVDEFERPIAGASIFVKGTTTGTVSGLDGKFSLDAGQSEGVLVVSFIGYVTFEQAFSSSADFSVSMVFDVTGLEGIVVIGYGSAKKKDLTGAVVQVSNMEQISSRPVSSVQDFFQGRLAGVTVQQQGGDPTKEAKVTIRGMGTVNAEDVLWVVDGMPYYGSPVNPNDIESVTILKDAASAAIYGAQASGGVILLTTKNAKDKKVSVSVNAYSGVQRAMNLPTPLTAEQQNQVYNLAADNSGKERNPARNPEVNPWGNVNRTNWVDEVFRSAAIYNTDVAVRGATESGRYSASFNYQNREGVLIGTQSEKLGLRLKTDFDLGKRFKIGQNLFVTRSEAIGTNTSSGYSGTIINAIYMPSAAPVYNEEGNFHGVAPEDSKYAGTYGDVYNPVALLLRPTTTNPVTYIDANIFGEYNILDGLKYRSSFSINQRESEFKKFSPKRPENGRPSEMNYLRQSSSRRNMWIWDNQVSYSKSFGVHKVDLTGVYSAQFIKDDWDMVEAQDFSREEEWYQYIGNAGEVNKFESAPSEEALTSAIGRVIYGYNDKYILSASIRRDQSSRLAKENNTDYFPAVSAAWKISNEPFMRDVQWLKHLKIRASWGQIGNIQSVHKYAYNVPMYSNRPTIGEGDAQRVPGYYVRKLSNRDLIWETSESTDLGLDAAFLNGQVEVTLDYFQKKTKDLILEENNPNAHVGVSKGKTANYGTVENKGVELALTYKGNFKDFWYSVSGNIASLENELIDLEGYSGDYISHGYDVREKLAPFRSAPGEELFSYYLITTDGIFESEKEIEEHLGPNGEILQPNAKPGDLKFLDSNGDGKIDGKDRTFKGNAFPDFTYGLNLTAEYKNFDLSLFLQGVAGAKVFNGYKYTTYNAALQGYNLDNRVLDAWSEDNRNADIPMLRLDDDNNNFETVSDWYLEDASYLRLKNLTVGYSLPASIMDNLVEGSSLRMYASCENLFTITGYSGMDPEVGGVGLDVGNYPVYRTFSAGISLKF